jgi:hypothetical protein
MEIVIVIFVVAPGASDALGDVIAIKSEIPSWLAAIPVIVKSALFDIFIWLELPCDR